MVVEIQFLEGQQILQVTYTAEDVSRQELAQQRKMVADALANNKSRRVLIDASALSELPSFATIFHHNAAISAENLLRKAKYAVVFESLGINEQFLETTGVNRGFQIKCFTSRQKAINWLGE